jgi:hypothetical protein
MYLLHLFCLSLVLRSLVGLCSHAIAFYVAAVLTTTLLTAGVAWLMQVGIEEQALKLRSLLRTNRSLRYALAVMQVSFIPVGVLLAIVRRIHS